MINIVLKEKEYAEKILEQSYLSDKPSFDLRVLAKYYCHEKKLNPDDIYEKLIKVMESKYKDFVLSKWQPILLDLSKKAEKHKLVEIEYVPITTNELLTIAEIESKPMKRLAFTLLSLAKYRNAINPNNNDWENYKFRDIFRMANIQATKKEQGFMIYDLKSLGLIKMNKIVDNLSINVCYVDKENSDEVLQIDDFRNLGYEYLFYCGESFIRCKKCNVLVRQNKQKNRIYCIKCAKYEEQIEKIIKCIDCGKEVVVDALDNQTTRCEECYKIYRRRYKANKEKERRNKKKL